MSAGAMGLPLYAATPGGHLLVLAIMTPAAAVLAMMALGPRHARAVALGAMMIGLGVAFAIGFEVMKGGKALIHVVGGWQPPLGLALRADGLSAMMLMVSAAVILMTGLFAKGMFGLDAQTQDGRKATSFWMLLMGLWAGLALTFLSQDLFNLYVALELLTFAAVPLASLDGRKETLAAALRYLMFALLGSLLYLLGAGLIYGAHGTLDIRLLASMEKHGPAVPVALGLMIAGLLAKSALFPLHLWLPPAHAGAPAAASAVLSALVIKAPVFLILRLVVDVAPPEAAMIAGQMLGALGAASILICSVMALRQERLKLMIAYSTVAQIGYLFLVLPLGLGGASAIWGTIGWTGGALQLVSHALAKAAMFMAAGLIAEAMGHDRIRDLGGFGRALPLTAATFGLAGLSLMGLPPSGGFIAKCLLLTAAVLGGHPFIAFTILAGGLLAGGYVFRVMDRALARTDAAPALARPIPIFLQIIPFLLAVAAVALGFLPLEPLGLLASGRPDMAGVSP
jgi:formate hydrogenlyase subunit 3/multisubunit Na+/H+ antiporter MnhD subunit